MKNRNIFTDTVPKTAILECEDFNEAIDLLLKHNGWTQEDLAKKMNFSTKHIRCVFRNDTEMTIDFAVKLGKISEIDAIFWIELYINKYKLY